MNPACGPPKPIGTPKRWLLPTAMSAPHSPGGVARVSASRSAAAVTSAPASWAAAARAAQFAQLTVGARVLHEDAEDRPAAGRGRQGRGVGDAGEVGHDDVEPERVVPGSG